MSQSPKSLSTILAQWQLQRPDIDPNPMALCGQIWRAAEILRKAVNKNLANYDIDSTRSDILFTLRRQGKNQQLSPSELADEMMLSTSAMTNRLDRLEQSGLINRQPDPNDRRGLKISLTEQGFALADEILASHVKTEADQLSNLSDFEQRALLNLLGKIT